MAKVSKQTLCNLRRLCIGSQSRLYGSPCCSIDDQAVSYRLTYFDLRYLAEGARQIFRHKGVLFEDVRIRREEWPALKPKTPFGQLPILEVDGHVIAQSYAINRYLARRFGLAGMSLMEEALVDSVAEAHKEFLEASLPYFRVLLGVDKGHKDDVYRNMIVPARDKYLPYLERFLAKSESRYLVGKTVTWADFVVSESLATWEELAPGFLDGQPKLKKYTRLVRELPNIAKWIDERPKNIF
ncbi:Glutathione S-transferase 1 [Toxocara canis]|uniref:Glutathione S-transferase 1 n=1 Tax=Toxocara canis TaxID=6265 RepID=A0A0B2VKK2_TOXCA|nr:Glutathione S-transferase 1 [Toxocara canis]